LTGELKDIWTAVQNFREKEKSGVADIVVYTEFGPDSGAPPLTPITKDFDSSSIEACMQSSAAESSSATSSEKIVAVSNSTELNGVFIERQDNDNDDSEVDGGSQDVLVAPVAADTQSSVKAASEHENLEFDKLSIGDKKSKTNSSSNENESSEKSIKVQNQNQKNKESQHHFFPKFLSSSKEKDKDTKDKEKVKGGSDEHGETKVVKTKKSLNFFRRNKNATGSPTHNNNSNSNANNIANE
jgi:hypothetical protein